MLNSCITVMILNYTLVDEETRTLISGLNETIEVSIEIYQTGISVPVIEFSQTYNSNNATVCVNNNLTSENYRLYAVTEYSADDHVHEFDYIQNFNINESSIPKNITLYDLETI